MRDLNLTIPSAHKSFCKITALLFLTLSSHSFSENTEEVLWSERIVALWKDEETTCAQEQIKAFKQAFPTSPYLSTLDDLEVRILISENNFLSARARLEENEKLKTDSGLQRCYLHTLYQLQDFDQIISFEKSLKIPNTTFAPLLGMTHLQKGLQTQDLEEMKKAKDYLTPHQDNLGALKALSEVHFKLKEYREVVTSIDSLLPRLQENEQTPFEMLKAAALAKFDPKSALDLFELLLSKPDAQKEHGSTIAKNILHLLAHLQGDTKLIDLSEQIRTLLEPADHYELSFLLGLSLAKTGQYVNAKRELLLAFESDKLSSEQVNQTIHALIFTAEKMNDLALLEKLSLKSQGGLLEKLYHARWRMLRTNSLHARAFCLIKECTKQFPSATAFVQLGISACETNRFDEAAAASLRLAEFDSTANPSALQIMKVALPRVSDKKEALKTIQLWSAKNPEEPAFALLHAQLLIDTKEPLAAYDLLLPFSENPSSKGSDIEALLCLCLKDQEASTERATVHGEKAIAMGYDEAYLHLELFNLYCLLHEKKEGDDAINRAADHLYAAIQKSPENVSPANKAWLCKHLISNAQKCIAKDWKAERLMKNNPNVLRALEVFSSIEHKGDIPLILHVAEALGWRKESEKRLKLLQESESLSEKNTPLDLISSIYFATGEAYEALGQRENAKQYYERVIKTLKQSYEADKAKLALHRIALQSNSLEMSRALNELKDIQLRKSLSREPLFLDTALLYVDVSCSQIESPLEKEERLKNLLEKMQADFSSGNTLFGKEYQNSRGEFIDKDHLLGAYMLYVDLYIQFLDAKHSSKRKQGRKVLATLKKELPHLSDISPELARRTHLLRTEIETWTQSL